MPLLNNQGNLLTPSASPDSTETPFKEANSTNPTSTKTLNTILLTTKDRTDSPNRTLK